MMFFSKKREFKVLMSGYKAGQFIERARMIDYLLTRKSDLLSCTKDDDCGSLATFIDGILMDLHEKEKEEN